MFVIVQFLWNVGIGRSEFSDFSDLVPKLRRKNEAKCEVAHIGIQNKEPCWWKWEEISRNSVLESEKLFVGEKHFA